MLLAATTTVVACTGLEDSAESQSPDPQLESQPVSFNAYVNRNTTRGGATGPLTTDSLKTPPSTSPDYLGHHNTAGFGVFAYYTNNQLYHQLALPDFMYNHQVTWQTVAPSASPSWTYTPLKYWPNEKGTNGSHETDYLTFFAYAPHVEVNPATGIIEESASATKPSPTSYGIFGLTRSKDSGDPFVKYRVSYDLARQVDLCRAEPQLNKEKPAAVEHINFNFQHALAALNVQIDADVDDATYAHSIAVDANTRIYVRSVTFEGFAEKGQLNLNIGNWNNLDCDCDLTSRPITIHDGRSDGKEGVATSLNESTIGLNPVIVQSEKYVTNSTTIIAPDVTSGVTNTPVNLFDPSHWPYATPAAPTTEEIATVLATPIYVIPTGAPLQVTIVYDVETYDPKLISRFLSDGQTCGSTIENNITATITNGNGDPIIMTAGNAYNIRLHLGMTSVKVNAIVTAWPIPGTSAEVHVPE